MNRTSIQKLLVIISVLTVLVSFYCLKTGISGYLKENENWPVNIGVIPTPEYELNLSNTSIESLSKYLEFKTLIPVFIGNGPNASVGFGISCGYYKPGDEISVSLEVYRPEYYIPGLKFSIKLFKVYNQNLVLLEYVDSVGPYYHKKFGLPPVQGAKYLLVVEAIMNNTVVDMIRSFIIVPIQYMDAAIYTDKQIYRAGEELTYIIVNLGSDPIIFGPYFYKIYKWIGYKWVLDTELTPKNIPLVAKMVYPGKETGFTIPLTNASPGVYKIVTEVEGVTTGKKLNLETVFIVTES